MTVSGRFLKLSTALCSALFAFSAAAQKEQWLDYHTGDEGHGYTWVKLSTNVPPDVAMPKLRAFAYYGKWSNGFDKGRWMVIDRETKLGACDRIFIDQNGNNRLDDETPIVTKIRSSDMVHFPPIKMLFKGEDGPVTYHLLAQLYQYDPAQLQLLLQSGCWYEGTVDLAGKKRRVKLYDRSVNGVFNNTALGEAAADELEVTGDKGFTRYLGKYLEVDGQLLRLEVGRDGAFIKVQKAEGVEYGKVQVAESITGFEAVSPLGHFVREPVKGEFTLPVGEYRVQEWSIKRKDAKQVAWTLTGNGFNRAGDFSVSKDKAASLPIGEPIRPVLEAKESKTEARFSLSLLGPLGEDVTILQGKERPRAPRLQVRSLVGDFRSTNTFEYG